MEKKFEENKMFAERLSLLMEEKNVSSRVLAEQVGVSHSALCYYIRLERDPSITIVKRLADFFEVSVDWIVGNGDVRIKKIAN